MSTKWPSRNADSRCDREEAALFSGRSQKLPANARRGGEEGEVYPITAGVTSVSDYYNSN